jgi:DNA mismatch repair protein MutL
LPKVRVLPDPLINQLAAGEVVERPSAVLKELMENALDSGAAVIEASWEGAGKRSIRVTDDGCGMGEEDALLALERHATSKITAYDDLFSVRTMGFRGEALPSIASVSRLTLLTSEDGERGTKIAVEGGRIKAVEPAFHPRGTTVIVEDLFFNTPARMKFLRTDSTELKFLHRVFTTLALAHPGRAFRLGTRGRVGAFHPACGDRRTRFFQVMGDDLERFFDHERLGGEGLEAEVFMAKQYATLPVPVFHYMFVNGRPVHDKLLNAFLRERRSGASFACFVGIAPDRVDVNIHPAKAEVRFRRPGEVLALLGFQQGVRPHFSPRPVPLPGPSPGTPAGPYRVQEPLLEAAAARALEWRYLGQVDGSFLVFEEKGGLLIVDPHAAHERILYETLLSSGPRETQRFLVPEIIALTGEEASRVEEALPALEGMGFEVGLVGPSRLRVAASPRLFSPREASAFVRVFIGTGGEAPLEGRVLASLACRSAVKVHQPMGEGEARNLVEVLKGCADPDHCPHGRPTLLSLGLSDLYRHFGRSTPVR